MRGRFFKNESGFTLPEMLVTMIIMVIVLFSLYNIFDMSVRVFGFGNGKVEANENARLGLERMEREIRAAYPYNVSDTDATNDYVLLNPNNPTQQATSLPNDRITFGNDLDGNQRIECPAPPARCEYITYRVSAAAPFTLQRINTATPVSSAGDPVVEFVRSPTAPQPGLRLDYFARDVSGNFVVPAGPADVDMVRIRLIVDVPRGNTTITQNLTTDVDLRNQGG